MPDTSTKNTERWVFAGRSLDHRTGKIGYDWRGEDGNIMRFIKLRAHVVGATYEVDVERTEKGISVTPRATYIPDAGLAEDTLVLQARDKLAYGSKQRIDAEARAAKNTQLAELLKPLEEAAAACRNYDDVEALISVVGQAMRKARRR